MVVVTIYRREGRETTTINVKEGGGHLVIAR